MRFLAILAALAWLSVSNAWAQISPGAPGTYPYVTATGSITAPSTTGAFNYGALPYTDTNNFGVMVCNQNSYCQWTLLNTNAGATASADYIVGNGNTTATTYYGDFGMNSTGFVGTGALGGAGNVYLYAAGDDLAIGTSTANAIHFVVNGGTTDAMTISSGGAVSIAGWVPSYGALLTSAGAPVAGGTGNAVGDVITLSTTGGTCSTAPKVAVSAVTSGAVTNFFVQTAGVCSVPPSGTLSQASTTGSGSGAAFNLSWGPYTPTQTSAYLGYGGGNYYAGGTGTEAAGLANIIGAENTFLGGRAGSGATGSQNTATGFNAFGTGGSGNVGYTLATGSGNTADGTDCMRNVSGAAANNTCVGYGALGALSSIIFTGNNMVSIGELSGNSVTSASRSVIIGPQVAQTTFSTGQYMILIGNDNNTDTYSASTSYGISIGGGKPGTSDVFTGYESGGNATADGNGNSAYGRQAGASWTNQTYMTAFGYTTAQNATGTQGTYFGGAAGLNAGSGTNQTYVGFTAGLSMTAGNATMVGSQAGRTGGSGCTYSVGVGASSLYGCNGTADTGLGYNTLLAVTSGSSITAVGSSVGSATCQTASGIILIGYSSGVDCPASNSTNWFNIGNALIGTTTAPTVSSGFGTSPSIPNGTSSAIFTVNVGTGGTASSGVISFGTTAAPHGWGCDINDVTHPGPNATRVSASTTTTVTFTNYSQTTGLAVAWSASDVLVAKCLAY